MAWYSSSWSYRFKVTIASAKVAADLTGLDVLITESNVPAGFWSRVDSAGADLVVTAGNGTTKLKRDLISIDTTGETLQLRVKTDVTAAAGGELYVYYGNAAATETNDTDTYDTNCLRRYEAEDNPATDDLTDRTGNQDGTFNGSMTAGDSVTGKQGQAIECDGVDDYVAVPGSDIRIGLPVTLNVWVKAQTAKTKGTVFSNERRTANVYSGVNFFADFSTGSQDIASQVNNNVGTGPANRRSAYDNVASYTDGEWYMLTYVVVGYSDVRLFRNGVQLTSQYSGTYNGAPVYQGEAGAVGIEKSVTGTWLKYPFDMLGFYGRALSADEVETRFNNENDPSTFYSCGAEEELDPTFAGTISAVSAVPAAPLLVALKTPGSWLWDWSKLGSDGDLLKHILDGYGGYWEPQASPDTDAPYDLDTVSSELYLRLYQATTDGAYDWWKADPTLWAARRTTVWRVRVLGYFEDSDTARSMRIRMFESPAYVSFQFDGDRLEIRDASGRKVIQTGYNSGAFTAVLEVAGTTARFRRINSHDPNLAFGSWDQSVTVATIDPESSDFVLASGNKGADSNHGFIKTLELFFADTALGGDITATSTVSGTLTTENVVPLAGEIDAVSTVAGTLTIAVVVNLAGEINAVSTVAGTLTVPSEIPIAGTITAVSSVGAYLNVPEAPELRRGLRLVAPGGRHPLRRIPFGWIRRDQAYTIRLEIVAERALTAPTLWAGSTWFRGQLDGGGFVAIGNDRATAIALGAFVKGQRKEFDLELIVPAAGEIRVDLLAINLGIGIDY